MSEPIPVVFMTTNFGKVSNGPAIYANYLWDAFVESEEIDFYLVAPDIEFKHDRAISVPRHKSSFRHYRNLQKAALDLARRLPKPPIIHSNTAHTTSYLQNYDGPKIAQINDYDAAEIFSRFGSVAREYGVRRLLSLCWRHSKEKSAHRFLDHLVCNSEFTRSRAIDCYKPENVDKLSVVYKAVNLNDFAVSEVVPFPTHLHGQQKLLFVGCNWRRKGLDIAIKALQRIDNPNVTLVIAGDCGHPADKAIRELPAELGIATRVQFLGNVDRADLPSLFKSCDLFVLPSRQEALGVAILEALASGLPVVASNVGGIPEIVAGSDCSTLVPVDSPCQLAEEIQKMLSKTNKDKALAESKAVANRFSTSRMIKTLTELYRSVQRHG